MLLGALTVLNRHREGLVRSEVKLVLKETGDQIVYRFKRVVEDVHEMNGGILPSELEYSTLVGSGTFQSFGTYTVVRPPVDVTIPMSGTRRVSMMRVHQFFLVRSSVAFYGTQPMIDLCEWESVDVADYADIANWPLADRAAIAATLFAKGITHARKYDSLADLNTFYSLDGGITPVIGFRIPMKSWKNLSQPLKLSVAGGYRVSLILGWGTAYSPSASGGTLLITLEARGAFGSPIRQRFDIVIDTSYYTYK